MAEYALSAQNSARIVLRKPNSLDGIEGFCFLSLRSAYENLTFFL